MPGERWKDDRLKFLQHRVHAYEDAQEEKHLKDYKQTLYKEYFDTFPELDEKKAAEERDRIDNWFNNNTGGRGTSQASKRVKKTTRDHFRAILRGKVEEKCRQTLQPSQAYSELYWNSRLKEPIMKEWEARKEQLGQSEYLKFMNQRVKEFYKAETDDVKIEVEHYCKNMKKIQAEKLEGDLSYLLPGEEELPEEEKTRRTRARKIQSAIERLEPVMSEIAKQVEEETGLVAHILLAGPEPARQGRIVTYTITAGKSIANKTFPNAYEDYSKNVKIPWEAFAKTCFSKEQKQKYHGIPFPCHDEDSNSCISRTTASKTTAQSQAGVSSRSACPSKRKAKDLCDDDDSPGEDNSDSGGIGDEVVPVEDHNVIEEEFDDLFLPNLPPERRIVEEKVSAAGMKLYKTSTGDWMSIHELRRLANIARNKHTMALMGIPESITAFGIKPTGHDHGNGSTGHELFGDDGSFRAPNVRPSLPQREHHPRASKQGITYVDGIIPASNAEGPIDLENDSRTEGPTATNASSAVVDNNVRCSDAMDVDKEPSPSDRPEDLPNHHETPSGRHEAALAVVAAPLRTTSETAAPLLESVFEVLTTASSAVSLAHESNAHFLDNLDFSTLPQWLVEPTKVFVSKFRGKCEDGLLESFIKLELALHPLNKKLTTENRPEAIPWWIKNARPMHKIPPKLDLASFSEAVRMWWGTIQPSWRGSEWPLVRSIPGTEDWQCMKLGGPNGLFLVILCLYWWRHLAKEDSDKIEHTEFLSLAEDITFVLRATHRAIQSSSNQPSSSTPTTSEDAPGPSTRTSSRKATHLLTSGDARGPARNLRTRH